MKIAILGATNIKHMSLISHYLDNIDMSKNQVDIIYTDKYDIDEKVDGITNYYKYSVDINSNWSFVKKAMKYYAFKPYATKILKENNYDFVIVWGSYTGHLFKNFLIKNYKERFILNIRDYFYENNNFIFARMAQLVNFSYMTTISSDGFLKFLPNSEKYQVIYSYNAKVIEQAKSVDEIEVKSPLKISFIGNVRFLDVNKKIISELKNDSRFLLQYFGTGSEALEEYAKDNNIKNVRFSGGFDIHETPKFLDDTDIINNLYGSKDIALDTALSIRMYYSLFLNKPILTSKDTYTNQQAQNFGLGIQINSKDLLNLGEQIIDYYNTLDNAQINQKRKEYITNVMKQNTLFYKKLESVFNE
ncbi:glycosyltransferase family protein [Staphylococcus haemolyticus]|uniref:capsular biosynthesis protein n=1 Tax=Staphylococcus haemolyticus TaxID=1283 RepID=UPI00069DDC57|nr:capsular biosynthesis protein [Staphylococcus haemolyticus]MBF9287822.1 capsular biosynthesis protein [Staphylococcus haemolyticus]MBG3868814.1 capsular biosynthesis protein [Staphylococcus haemolyticus]MBW5901077.1 capsular biosynthesis protein [Staphylococcus haemolyticus]MCH4420019.1 capsular biosynthesis protein [Staphylococcus haemolyticus]MCH4520010.1 capsular biosynthesis protein [Staphylococcus haemolyticus]